MGTPEKEKESDEVKVATIRKASLFVQQSLGLTISDMPAALKNKIESWGRSPDEKGKSKEPKEQKQLLA